MYVRAGGESADPTRKPKAWAITLCMARRVSRGFGALDTAIRRYGEVEAMKVSTETDDRVLV